MRKILSIMILSLLFLQGCGSDGSADTKKQSVEDRLLKNPKFAKSLGIDPNKDDTDGDGLSDKYELKFAYSVHKPDNNDTDGDGILDGDEDEDNDGLTALEEQKYQTYADRNDSDRDGLSDGDEVKNYHTDPNKADTDGDGLSDGFEIEHNLDPKDKSDADTAVSQYVGYKSDNNGSVFKVTTLKVGELKQNDIILHKLSKSFADDKAPAIRVSPLYSADVKSKKGIDKLEISIDVNTTDKNITDPNDLLIFVKKSNYYVPIDYASSQVVEIKQNGIVNIKAILDHKDSKGSARAYFFVVMEKGKYSAYTQRGFDFFDDDENFLELYLTSNTTDSTDSDGDGLLDQEEVDVYHTNPQSADSDGDGIEDGVEVEFGMDPNSLNSDGDYFDDAFEFANMDEGYSPTEYDRHIDAWTFYDEYSDGFIYGDYACEDDYNQESVPCTLGSISAGFVVYGDLVSIAYDGEHGNYGWLAVDAAALIPGAGDALGAGGKVAKFVVKNGIHARSSRKLIAKVARDIDSSSFFIQVMRVVDKESINIIKSHGLSDEALHRLLKGGKNSVKELADILEGAKSIKKVSDSSAYIDTAKYADAGYEAGFLTGKNGWRIAEDIAKKGVASNIKHISFDGIDGFKGGRYPDVLDKTNNIMKEVKTGRQSLTATIKEQIEKDKVILEERLEGVEEIEWHFFPSGRSNSIGMTPALKRALDEAGIPYVIHLP